MDSKFVSELVTIARECALEAGRIIRQKMDEPRLTSLKTDGEVVTDTDHLSQEAVLEVISKRYPDHAVISEEAPDTHPLPGEPWIFPEGPVWLIDPIDGTSNFASGLPFFCVAVGVAVNGEAAAGAIYDPVRDELFLAGKGLGATLNEKPLRLDGASPMSDSLVTADWGWGFAPGGGRIGTIDGLRALAPHCRATRVLGSAALGLTYVGTGRTDIYLSFGLKPWDMTAAAIIVEESGGALSALNGKWTPGSNAVIAAHPDLLKEAVSLVANAVR